MPDHADVRPVHLRPAILDSFGLGERHTSNLGSALISIVFVLGCLPALRLVDRAGRRPVITWSFALMVVPLVVLGGGSVLPIGAVIVCFCTYALLSGGPTVLEWTGPRRRRAAPWRRATHFPAVPRRARRPTRRGESSPGQLLDSGRPEDRLLLIMKRHAPCATNRDGSVSALPRSRHIGPGSVGPPFSTPPAVRAPRGQRSSFPSLADRSAGATRRPRHPNQPAGTAHSAAPQRGERQ
ncbi:MFS transporter [Streptomyces sp. BRA346]|uniref:MFS transporter n=1 Tax=Streptomyces sp. BRA346 TaxID=2878199 RepID=UPI00406349BD